MKRRDTTNSPHRILLVDDDSQVAKYLTTVLEENGYSVTAATSGKEALASLRECRPDLLILDLNMPGLDGFDFLKIKRAEFPYLRILVISGYLKGSLLKAAELIGATATLQKPIRSETLVTSVREMLA
jgi:CheY-like chemotaxis protein